MLEVNGVVVPLTMFPDNTSQIWKLPFGHVDPPRVAITWEFKHEGELMHLAQLVLLLRESYGVKRFDLYLPYLPYGRQDKPVDNNATFALYAFAQQLNVLGFNRVFLTDPHSPAAKTLINNSYVTYNFGVLDRARGELRPTLVFPDKGAAEKYLPILCPDVYIRCEKVRIQETGVISARDFHIVGSTKVNHLVSVRERLRELGPLLIVDDICDGGATFIGIAKDLLEAGAKSVNLFVSHGLFTKGVQVLRDAGIERIFTKEGEIL